MYPFSPLIHCRLAWVGGGIFGGKWIFIYVAENEAPRVCVWDALPFARPILNLIPSASNER